MAIALDQYRSTEKMSQISETLNFIDVQSLVRINPLDSATSSIPPIREVPECVNLTDQGCLTLKRKRPKKRHSSTTWIDKKTKT